MSDQVAHEPTMPGEDLTALTASMTASFTEVRSALEAGQEVVVILRAADLEGQGTPLDAALATGLLGMVRTLAIEGAKPGWRVNVVAVGGEEVRAAKAACAALEGSELTGQLLQTGGANLGKVVA